MGALERKPGGPDNWIETVGGLPQYIERIAIHLHRDRGMTISHAIATAVNTVKRWARKGTVVKWNDPKNNRVTTITAAQAARDVASWEAKKARYRAMKLAGAASRTGARGTGRGRLSLSLAATTPEGQVTVTALAARANAVADPVARGRARAAVLDLAMTKDGRKSYKNQGKWKHGFVPVDESAKTSKAKGSPIAKRRINRLYGSTTKANKSSREAVKRTLAQRAAKGAAHGQQVRATTGKKGGGAQERVQTAGKSLHADIRDATKSQRQSTDKRKVEVGKGRRATSRATQPWDQIPESQKTIRGGKRYVMSFFRGRTLLTEWVGNNPGFETPEAGKRQYGRISEATLRKMDTGTLRKLLRSGKNSKEIRSAIRKVLDAKLKEKKGKG